MNKPLPDYFWTRESLASYFQISRQYLAELEKIYPIMQYRGSHIRIRRSEADKWASHFVSRKYANKLRWIYIG